MTNNNGLTTKEADSKRSMHNGKPYRTKAQKVLARETAYKGKDGTFHSTAPVSHHPKPKGE